MKKRISAIFLIVAMLVGFCLPAFAATTMKLTGVTYPTTMKEGEPFVAKGVITSDYYIRKVVIGAYNSSGAAEFEYTGLPGEKTYNINNVDYLLYFSRLKSGSYTYKIVASDDNSSNVVLLNQKFTVSNGEQAASTLKLTNANYPTALDVGEGLSVTGVVSSNYNISKIVIGAYKSDGTKGFEQTVTPGAKSYDLSSIDALLTFSKLGVGTYTYKIVASDAVKSHVELLNKTFTVGGGASITGDLTKVKWNVADISYWNSDYISSWSKIAADLDAIIVRIGFSYTGSKKSEEDSKFSGYYSNAKKNNIPVGVYFYAAATTAAEASKEADFVISLLKKYNCQLEMPVYYDLETEAQVELSQSQCTEVARAFCDKLKAAGYFVGIYCNKYFARDELYASKLSEFQFWIAEYGSNCTYSGEYGMWQYTESGWVSGISRQCDKNYCYYDYPAYIKANGLNGFTKTADPQFSFKTGTNLSVNESKKEVYLKQDPGLTADQFISKYVTSKDVTVKTAALSSDGKVATGTTITAEGSGKSFGPYAICLYGDINSDSKINSADALLALQHSVGTTVLRSHALTSADWNGDGKVNSADALAILTYSVSR